MFETITKTCQKFNTAFEHRGNPRDEEKMSLEYRKLDLAKAIIEDLDEHNAKCIAKIILGFVE